MANNVDAGTVIANLKDMLDKFVNTVTRDQAISIGNTMCVSKDLNAEQIRKLEDCVGDKAAASALARFVIEKDKGLDSSKNSAVSSFCKGLRNEGLDAWVDELSLHGSRGDRQQNVRAPQSLPAATQPAVVNLEQAFTRAYSTLINGLTEQEVVKIATELRSRGMIIVPELEAIKIRQLTPTDKASALIDTVGKKGDRCIAELRDILQNKVGRPELAALIF